jgi:hypothetical protein
MKLNDYRELEEMEAEMSRWTKWTGRGLLIIIVVVAIVFACCGCTTIKYGDLEYMRLGGSQIDNFSLTKLPDGDILVEFDKRTAEGIGPIVGAAVEGAIKAMK